ncbi:MAG: glycoside hydrolase family 3 C-terminal domain-containing protein, partial [Bacteroidota bacterium]|nr:glycoside hydrolase family 3 C-terminal domain-containing protein [Bacteroidota bacterium]
ISGVKSGAIDVYVIDDKVRRLLRAGYDTGLFDKDTTDTKDTLNVEAHNQLALQAARESIVLLKNYGGLLPLHREEIESIALIGPNTYEARVGGGGSSQVNPRYAISPYAGIQKLVGDKISISSTYGIAAAGDIIPLGKEFMRPLYPLHKQPGLKAEYFANTELKSPPALSRVDSIIDFVWGYDSPHPDLKAAGDDHNFSVRWSGKLVAANTGIHKLNLLCHGACRLYIKEELLIDDWQNNPDELRTAEYTFESGQEYDIIIEYLFESGIANIKFGWELPGQDLISAAVYHARHADVAIVFAGLSNRFESEDFNRKTLDLPNQELLIKAVVEANPNTIVVMETGSPVVMENWIRDVPAVLQAWYPGQEGGNAIAEVLFGDFNPTGRLPFTIAWSARDYPGLEEYQEDIYIGYRYFDKYQNKALFSFGHGLSYSTIGIGKLLLHRSTGTYNFYATIEMKNMGNRKGTEILQLYIHDPDNKIARPEKELKRFKRITLEPGEKMVVRIPFNRSDFAYFNEETSNWAVKSGIYEVMIGTSADNIKLRKKIEIK